MLIYVFNASRDVLPATKIIGILALFWTYVVIGGWLGLLLPQVEFTSPMEKMLPHSIVSNDFVKEMVHPGFAEIQDILGYPTPRPSAPFIYTNDWGGNFALLVPFVVLAWSSPIKKRFKMFLGGVAGLSVVPVLLSLNRGLWLSLGVGLFYAAVRLAMRGKERPLIGVVGLLSFVAIMVFLSPLHSVVDDRLATPHSNNRRVSLYQEAALGAIESPIFGFGAPRPSKWNPNAPSVGTQGADLARVVLPRVPRRVLVRGLVHVHLLDLEEGEGSARLLGARDVVDPDGPMAGVRHDPDADPHRDDRHRTGDA